MLNYENGFLVIPIFMVCTTQVQDSWENDVKTSDFISFLKNLLKKLLIKIAYFFFKLVWFYNKVKKTT